MANFKVDTSPDVLTWAREAIGLSLDDAAKKLDVSLTDLRMWEEGGDEPTIAQLRRMAQVYKRPLAVFLLPEPPQGFSVIRDFRLLQANQSNPWSPELHRAYWRVQMQREVAEEIADIAEETPAPLAFTISLDDPPESAAEQIRNWLGLANRDPRDNDDHLNFLTEEIEARAILVTQVSGVSLEEMRGFSVSDQPFPVIVLNGADTRNGRVFTLMHELIHILLHAGGLCDLEETRQQVQTETERIERFCNQVAAAVLMPRAHLMCDQRVAAAFVTASWSDDELARLATGYGVSREAMLLRLVSLGRASWDYYFDRRPHFHQIYEDLRESQQAQSGGPGYYRKKVRDFGRRYVLTVLDAYHRRAITGSEVSDYLDMKLNNVPKLQSFITARK